MTTDTRVIEFLCGADNSFDKDFLAMGNKHIEGLLKGGWKVISNVILHEQSLYGKPETHKQQVLMVIHRVGI